MKVFLLLVIISLQSVAQVDTIRSLTWLSGSWESVEGDVVIEESWSYPAGNSLIGWSRTISKNKTIFHEFMVIQRNDQGSISFFANPSNQDAAVFVLTELHERSVLFEKKDHDFPQRIIYRLVSTDSLIGRIEGHEQGKFRSVDFLYKRTATH